MARPALSATRATAVIDLLTGYPGRAFSITEIVRATGINISSCHAVLSALTKKGYLARLAGEKGYILGKALIAAGHASLGSNPLVARAQSIAEQLSVDTGLATFLSTAVDDEILSLASFVGRNGVRLGMRPGQRFPLAAPAGAPFLAWANEKAVQEWISRAGGSSASERLEWMNALALIKQRAFQVTLQTGVDFQYAELMTEMARGQPTLDFKRHTEQFINSRAWHLNQPTAIQDNDEYDVLLIAAPVFTRQGDAALNLSMGGFERKISGKEIENFAQILLQQCIEIMNNDRTD